MGRRRRRRPPVGQHPRQAGGRPRRQPSHLRCPGLAIPQETLFGRPRDEHPHVGSSVHGETTARAPGHRRRSGTSVPMRLCVNTRPVGVGGRACRGEEKGKRRGREGEEKGQRKGRERGRGTQGERGGVDARRTCGGAAVRWCVFTHVLGDVVVVPLPMPVAVAVVSGSGQWQWSVAVVCGSG